jgi:hypothetical protein
MGFAVLVAPPVAAATDPVQSWIWPMIPPHVVTAFVPPDSPYGPGHRGVDLAGTTGQPVRAVADGYVSYVGRTFGYGIIAITHGDVRSTYQPVNTRMIIGTDVKQGDVIGVLGFTGSHCHVQCLHWGALRGDDYLDPLQFLTLGPPRLLPYWDVPAPPWAARDTGSGVPDAERTDASAIAPVSAGGVATHDVGTLGKTVATGPEDAAATGVTTRGRAQTVQHVLTIGLSIGVGAIAAWLTVLVLRRRM